MIETEGLTHIHLVVADLTRSLRFYQGAFGMEEMYRDGPDMVFLRTPGSRDTITLNGAPTSATRPGVREESGTSGSASRTTKISVTRSRRPKPPAGVSSNEENTRPGVSFAYVADPDGNIIEL